MNVSMWHGRRALLTAALLIATAGCGGSGSGASTVGPSVPAAATPVPAASTGAAATDAASTDAATTDPAAATASAPATSDGGNAGGVCDLVTTAELAQALASDGIKTTLIPGPPDTCAFASADGTPLGAMVLLTSGGGTVYGAIHQGSTITDFSGIGDKAFYSPEMQTVSVLKGDAMLTITVTSATTDEQRRDMEKAIATAAAPRM